jgi:hypothetical protein
MAAPKGNKYGSGSTTSGRPRKYDLEEEAKALIEWANKKDSLVLRLFAAIRGYSEQSKLHEYCEQSEAFREAYNQAKMIIGARREQLLLNGKGHYAPFQRYAALYDPDLKQHEKEIKQQENIDKQIVFIPKQPFDNDDSPRKA